MKAKHQVHNLIILDESGSMSLIKNPIIQGFNELVQSIKGMGEQFPNQEHYITFVSFNSFGNKVHHFAEPVKKLDEIDDSKYQPAAMTPLYDAMGFSINKLKKHLEKVEDYNVLVTIMTDGEENSSREYSGSAIKAMVNELKEARWTFTYIGTDHDISNAAASLAIDNSFAFDKSDSGIKSMFAMEKRCRAAFYNKIDAKEELMMDYFAETEEGKD